jgi:hypothetical protein
LEEKHKIFHGLLWLSLKPVGIERWKRNLPLETQVMTYSGHTALMWSRTTSATTR